MPRVEKVGSVRKIKITRKSVFIALGAVVLLAVGWYVFLVPSPDQAVRDTNELVIQKEYSKAKSELQLAQLKAFTNNDHAELISGLTNVAMATKDYESAASYLQQQEKYHPSSYDFFSSEGDLYLIMGKKDLAIAKYKKALELIKKQTGGIRTVSPGYLQAQIDGLEK